MSTYMICILMSSSLRKQKPLLLCLLKIFFEYQRLEYMTYNLFSHKLHRVYDYLILLSY